MLFSCVKCKKNVNVNVRVFSAPPTQTGPAKHYNSNVVMPYLHFTALILLVERLEI